MNEPAYESAEQWNRRHPPGTAVDVHLRDGRVLRGRTAGHAQQWGRFAVLRLRGSSQLWTTCALQPVAPHCGE